MDSDSPLIVYDRALRGMILSIVDNLDKQSPGQSYLHEILGSLIIEDNGYRIYNQRKTILIDRDEQNESDFAGHIGIGFTEDGESALSPDAKMSVFIMLDMSNNYRSHEMTVATTDGINGRLINEFRQDVFLDKYTDPDMLYVNTKRIGDPYASERFRNALATVRGYTGMDYAETPAELQAACKIASIPYAHSWEYVCKKFIDALRPIIPVSAEVSPKDDFHVRVSNVIFDALVDKEIYTIALPARGGLNLAIPGDLIHITTLDRPDGSYLGQIIGKMQYSSYQNFLVENIQIYQNDACARYDFRRMHNVDLDDPVYAITLQPITVSK